MTRAYIAQSGRITNTTGVQIRDFRWKRIFLIVGVVSILVISNPANDIVRNQLKLDYVTTKFFPKEKSQGTGRKKRKNRTLLGSFTLDWLGIEIDIRSSFPSSSSTSNPFIDSYDNTRQRGLTNYGMFSLSENGQGVEIGMLFSKVPICSYYGFAPKVCNWIASNGCHGMQVLDSRNKAFTALRIIQVLKLSSFLLQKTNRRPSTPFLPPATLNNILQNPLSCIASTLHQNNWYTDLLFLNSLVYPSLVVLERITSAVTSTDQAASVHFFAMAFGLLFVVGGLSNFLAAYVTHKPLWGMKGGIAACVGYMMAAKPNRILWRSGLGGGEVMEFTAGNVLWMVFVTNLTSILLSMDSLGMGIEETIAWAIGGVFGYSISNFHLEQYGLWWTPLWPY